MKYSQQLHPRIRSDSSEKKIRSSSFKGFDELLLSEATSKLAAISTTRERPLQSGRLYTAFVQSTVASRVFAPPVVFPCATVHARVHDRLITNEFNQRTNEYVRPLATSIPPSFSSHRYGLACCHHLLGGNYCIIFVRFQGTSV